MHPLLRYTLDLFDVLPPPSPVAHKPKRVRQATVEQLTQAKVPPAEQQKQELAAKTIALFASPLALVAEPTRPQAIAPMAFIHPQATRETRLGHAHVAYAFTRAKRRSIGFVVGAEGLSVRAPQWIALSEVESALQEKAQWILRKLSQTRERHMRQEQERIVWRHEVKLPYLGASLVVLLDPSHALTARSAQLDAYGHDLAASPAANFVQSLRVGLPMTATPEQISDVVQTWLMRQAHANFTQRLQHFAPLLKVRCTRMRLSNAASRWGSAGADGSIRLNWRLIHFRQEVIDYVVVHELSHLRVMDHSPRFWDVVRSVLPQYESLRDELKRDLVPRW